MRKVEFVLEKETYRILWDFEIQTDNLIPVVRLEEGLINKKKKRIWI